VDIINLNFYCICPKIIIIIIIIKEYVLMCISLFLFLKYYIITSNYIVKKNYIFFHPKRQITILFISIPLYYIIFIVFISFLYNFFLYKIEFYSSLV